jgi:uroporphyrinogen-III synthase
MSSPGVAPAVNIRPAHIPEHPERSAIVRFLEGRTVLVTRPLAQATPLIRFIEAAGGKASVLPTLDILPIADSAPLDAALSGLPGYDLVVFVSANAVSAAIARCSVLGIAGLEVISRAAAPGPGTAVALVAAGVREVVSPPARFDSEGLIAELAVRSVRTARALILRGADDENSGSGGSGREELVRWLRGNGASVELQACYRRVHARLGPAELAEMIAGPAPAATLVTSSEGGRALVSMLGDQGVTWIARTPVFVPHPRIAEALGGAGFSEVHVTDGGDSGLMRGLEGHFRTGGV